MAVISREELDRLELSDEARAAFQSVLDENSTLTGKTREQEATSRLEELKGYGFTDRPGALKLYRRVFLADDKRPAIVLFSDKEGETDKKESLTALEILDQFIDGLRGAEGKVTFSDQHVEQPGDEKPPSEDGDKRPVGDRVKDARDFLYPNGR